MPLSDIKVIAPYPQTFDFAPPLVSLRYNILPIKIGITSSRQMVYPKH